MLWSSLKSQYCEMICHLRDVRIGAISLACIESCYGPQRGEIQELGHYAVCDMSSPVWDPSSPSYASSCYWHQDPLLNICIAKTTCPDLVNAYVHASSRVCDYP